MWHQGKIQVVKKGGSLMRSVGKKVAILMIVVLLPLFFGVTFFNQYRESQSFHIAEDDRQAP